MDNTKKNGPQCTPEGTWERGYGNTKEIYDCSKPNMDFDNPNE